MRVHANFVPVVVVVALLGLGGPLRADYAELVWSYSDCFDKTIPADPEATKGWMDDAILRVPDHLIIEDLDVSVSLTHTNVFDLRLIVTSPSGTSVVLNSYDPFTEYFSGADYRQTVFDDEAEISIGDATPPFTGRFRVDANDALSAFDGEDAFGDWHLEIYDAHYSDTGSLDSFGLTITTPEPATAALLLAGLGIVRLARRRSR
ncbi:MAG: proprotein convertase P-domain-containing protein [Phycisphaerales bacterium]|nr:MAG: proprotein convertase P-domain-containing protein [Phycisphaerales bacterium]